MKIVQNGVSMGVHRRDLEKKVRFYREVLLSQKNKFHSRLL